MEAMSRQAKWQKKMKASGRCVTCGKPAVTSKHCQLHREYTNQKSTEHMSKKYAKKKEKGECVLCGRPAVTAVHCEFHRQQQNKITLAHYHAKKRGKHDTTRKN